MILSLIIIELGSFIVYDTFIYQEKDDSQKENNSIKNDYNLEKRTAVQS